MCEFEKTLDGVQNQLDRIIEVCEQKRPLLVISCATFNQNAYLRDALEGFVMQQTDFPFVAIVHDDASTDGSTSIIREYSERYPDIILPIFEEENQYSKRNGSLGRILRTARASTGARYIAMCEGDDYWTDPLKLQKQVDFLEAHPDYSMCFGNAIEHWEDGSKPDGQFSYIEDRDYNGIEFVENWIVPTATVVVRKSVYDDARLKRLQRRGKLIAGDILLFLTCSTLGKVKGFSDIFSVYRRLRSGAVMSYIDKRPLEFLIHEIELGEAFGGEIKRFFKHKIANRFVLEFKKIKSREKINLRYLWRAFLYSPVESITQLIKYI